mgnify:CR=1 FL=1|jgi:CMP-N,N'-diacetyllegionaminic acid synthase
MIAIIPARGGSKGLPNKNTKLLNNKPLIAHTIEAALKSKYIEDIIVSSDSTEIVNIAKKHGANSPFLRPSHLATDNSEVMDSIFFTIDKLNQSHSANINDFILLQVTSPLRTTKDIDDSIEIFITNKANSVVSVTESSQPQEWFKYLNDKNEILNISTKKHTNRQNYPKSYVPNGAIYIANYDFLKKEKTFFGTKSFAYIMPKKRSIDIDSIDDFLYADFLLKNNEITF